MASSQQNSNTTKWKSRWLYRAKMSNNIFFNCLRLGLTHASEKFILLAMKLVRFGLPGQERPGVWLDNSNTGSGHLILDVRAMAFDIEDYNEHFFACHGIARLESLLLERNRKTVAASTTRLGPPLARPGKIICMGKNYEAHAREFGGATPSAPIIFSKAATAINGPFDPIVLPPAAGRVDWEVELAVVIGKTARQVAEKRAMDYVAGYTILNDVTDRDAQKTGQQWWRGKSPDTFCPLGPFLATADEIPHPDRLRLTSSHNGRRLQDGNTADLIFKIPFLIAYISSAITLLPGDILATGTPSGIGSAQTPPVLLKPGDTIELEIENLGSQKSPII